MYGNIFNPGQNIERLKKQKEEIDNLINNYQNMQQPVPVNNIINTNQTQSSNNCELRVLNEGDQVENIGVINDTIFMGEDKLIIKKVNGLIEKWSIKKVYPIDAKDKKISDLEDQIRELKGMIGNEHTKSDKSTKDSNKSNADVDVNGKPTTETDNQ